MNNFWEIFGVGIAGVSILVGAAWRFYLWNKADRKAQFDAQQKSFDKLQAALNLAKDKEVAEVEKQALRDANIQSFREEHNLRIVQVENDMESNQLLQKEMKADIHSIKESLDKLLLEFAVIKDREGRNGYTH